MGRSYLVSRISYFVIRISHLTLHKIRFTPYAYLTLHATLSRFRHLAFHESFPRNHQSKRAAPTARFELCLARNSRRGVESRSWNAGLRRELAHAVFNGQPGVAHGQAFCVRAWFPGDFFVGRTMSLPSEYGKPLRLHTQQQETSRDETGLPNVACEFSCVREPAPNCGG